MLKSFGSRRHAAFFVTSRVYPIFFMFDPNNSVEYDSFQILTSFRPQSYSPHTSILCVECNVCVTHDETGQKRLYYFTYLLNYCTVNSLQCGLDMILPYVLGQFVLSQYITECL